MARRPKPSVQEQFAVIPERTRLPSMDQLVDLASDADEISQAADELAAAAGEFSAEVETLQDEYLDREERAEARDRLREAAETLSQLLAQLGAFCDPPEVPETVAVPTLSDPLT